MQPNVEIAVPVSSSWVNPGEGDKWSGVKVTEEGGYGVATGPYGKIVFKSEEETLAAGVVLKDTKTGEVIQVMSLFSEGPYVEESGERRGRTIVDGADGSRELGIGIRINPSYDTVALTGGKLAVHSYYRPEVQIIDLETGEKQTIDYSQEEGGLGYEVVKMGPDGLVYGLRKDGEQYGIYVTDPLSKEKGDELAGTLPWRFMLDGEDGGGEYVNGDNIGFTPDGRLVVGVRPSVDPISPPDSNQILYFPEMGDDEEKVVSINARNLGDKHYVAVIDRGVTHLLPVPQLGDNRYVDHINSWKFRMEIDTEAHFVGRAYHNDTSGGHISNESMSNGQPGGTISLVNDPELNLYPNEIIIGSGDSLRYSGSGLIVETDGRKWEIIKGVQDKEADINLAEVLRITGKGEGVYWYVSFGGQGMATVGTYNVSPVEDNEYPALSEKKANLVGVGIKRQDQ